MEPERWSRVPAPLLVVAGAALWGSTGTAQALGPDATTPAAVGTLRIVVGALGLTTLVAARSRGVRGLAATAGTGRAAATAVAMLAIAAYQVTFFAGVAATGVALGTLVGIGSAPIATGVIATVMGDRPSSRWVAGTAVTLVGAVLLVTRQEAAIVDPVGILLAVGAGVSYAVYTLAAKRVIAAGVPSAGVMAATWLGGALLLAPLLAVVDLAWLRTLPGVAMVAWLGIATVAIAYLLYGAGLARLEASTVASLTLAEPLTATILAVVVLGERLVGVAAVGAALVAAGLVVVSVPRSRRRSAAETGPTPHP